MSLMSRIIWWYDIINNENINLTKYLDWYKSMYFKNDTKVVRLIIIKDCFIFTKIYIYKDT